MKHVFDRQILLALVFLFVPAWPLSAADPASTVFLEQHCFDCHGKDSPRAGLDLTSLSADLTDAQIFARWVKIHDRIQSGEMPPKPRNRPDTLDASRFLAGLAEKLTQAEQDRKSTRLNSSHRT